MKKFALLLLIATLAVTFSCITGDDGGDDNKDGGTAASVSGRVLDAEGAALDSVMIALSGGDINETLMNDKDGLFLFADVPAGTYTVTPAREGYTFSPATRSVTVAGENISLDAFTGTATGGSDTPDDGDGATISGRIVDIDGTGISGVEMSATNLLNRYTATTEADGSFSFTGVDDGVYGLVHNKYGYTFIPSFQNVSVGGADVYMEDIIGLAYSDDAYYVVGRIISPDGLSVADATLSITSMTGNRYEATSNDLGWYVFENVEPATYNLVVNKYLYTFTPEFLVVTVADDHVMLDPIIATAYTDEGSTVTGRIIDTNGAGISGVVLSITSMTGLRYESSTCSLGYYTFEGVEDATYGMVYNKSGYTFSPEFQNVTVSGENVQVPDIIGYTGDDGGDDNGGGGGIYIISGTVYDKDRDGFAGVQMHLSGEDSEAQVLTDNDGNFTFMGLSAGTYMVVPIAINYVFTPFYMSVTITDSNVTIEFQEFTGSDDDDTEYSITGRIADNTGNPLSGVTLTVAGGPNQAFAATDDDGLYTVEGLTNGMYTLIPQHDGYTFAPPFAQVTIMSAPAVQNFTGTPTGGGNDYLSLSGRVVDASGNAISGVAVDVINLAMNMLVGHEETGSDGRYEFDELFTGAFLVTPSKEGYTFEPSSQQITLAASAVVADDFVGTRSGGSGPGDVYGKIVKIYDTDAPVDGTTVTLKHVDTKDSTVVSINEEGVYSFAGVAEGKYTVTPHNEFFVFEPRWKEITYSGIQVADVNFKGGHTISGGVYKEIKDDSGEVTGLEGVPGVEVTTKRIAIDFSEIGFTYAPTYTDAFGHYHYDLLTFVPGEYKVEVEGEYEPPFYELEIVDRNLVDIDFTASEDDDDDNDNDDDANGPGVRAFYLDITNTTTQNLPERNDETVWKGQVNFELEIKEDATFGAITGEGELKITGGGSSHNDSESCTWTRTGTVNSTVGGNGEIGIDPEDDKVKLMLHINLGMSSHETIVTECIDEEGHKTTTTNEGGAADMPFELVMPAVDGYTISRTITPGGGVTGHVVYILHFGKYTE